jgi:hypothetical protein
MVASVKSAATLMGVTDMARRPSLPKRGQV